MAKGVLWLRNNAQVLYTHFFVGHNSTVARAVIVYRQRHELLYYKKHHRTWVSGMRHDTCFFSSASWGSCNGMSVQLENSDCAAYSCGRWHPIFKNTQPLIHRDELEGRAGHGHRLRIPWHPIRGAVYWSISSYTWQFKRLPSKLGWDRHNYIAITMDVEGYLHMSGNMHAVPLVYFRITKPFDIALTFSNIHLC